MDTEWSAMVKRNDQRWTYEASTTSRPQGEMDMDPTGWSTLIDMSKVNVGLSKADSKPRWASGSSMTAV